MKNRLTTQAMAPDRTSRLSRLTASGLLAISLVVPQPSRADGDPLPLPGQYEQEGPQLNYRHVAFCLPAPHSRLRGQILGIDVMLIQVPVQAGALAMSVIHEKTAPYSHSPSISRAHAHRLSAIGSQTIVALKGESSLLLLNTADLLALSRAAAGGDSAQPVSAQLKRSPENEGEDFVCSLPAPDEDGN